MGTAILLAASLSARAVDVEFYGVVKMQRFAQANPVTWQTRINGVADANVNGFTATFQFDDGVLSPSGRPFYRAREGADFGGGP